MKRMYSSILLIVLIFMSMALPVSAENTVVVPRYTHISTVYGNIVIDETYGIATCTGRIDAKQIVPVEVDLFLQRKENGKWVTVKSWNLEGTRTAICTKNYAISTSYEHRVCVWGYVLDNNGNIIETGNVFSYP